jgi:ribonuclease BN (tRNA processing enzyme)
MELVILGSGTAIPSKEHSPAGIVVIHEDHSLLIDIGPGTLTRLAQVGIPCDLLDYLLLSHFHPDHTLDLVTLLQVFDSSPDSQRTRPFSIIGGHDLNDFIDRLLCLYPEITPQTYQINNQEVFRDEFRLHGLGIKTAPTFHTSNSVAYSFQNTKHKLVYSGDAAPQGELVTLADNADILVCECSFPSGWNSVDHLNADSVGIIADQAAVKTLIITHCYPPALNVDLEKQIKQNFKGKIILATDGLRISI